MVRFCKWLRSQGLTFITAGMVHVWFLQVNRKGVFLKAELPENDYGSIWNHSGKFPEA